jgi:hypothetical protein
MSAFETSNPTVHFETKDNSVDNMLLLMSVYDCYLNNKHAFKPLVQVLEVMHFDISMGVVELNPKKSDVNKATNIIGALPCLGSVTASDITLYVYVHTNSYIQNNFVLYPKKITGNVFTLEYKLKNNIPIDADMCFQFKDHPEVIKRINALKM